MSNKLQIIAGPCSIDEKNKSQVHEIISFNKGFFNPIHGVRVVGLKSRTVFSNTPSDMGLDGEAFAKVIESMSNGSCDKIKNQITIPSIEIAKEIYSKYQNIYIASEIVDPAMQLPFYSDLKDRFIPWNPAVNQLGWQARIMGEFAKKNNWCVGLKNAKNFGISIQDSEKNNQPAPMEKVWKGLASYTQIQDDKDKILMIQRGVEDFTDKTGYRNYPVHQCAARVKDETGYKMFFDPSHTFGPKLKDKIVLETIEIMKLKTPKGEFIYDGILIEVGDSKTDTLQHITLNELSNLIDNLSKFRAF